MQNVDVMIDAGGIITMAESGQKVLANHSIMFSDDKIIAILPTEQAKQAYQASTVYNKTNHLVMPGLVNSHTHVPMNLLRGYADDVPFMTWWRQHIFPAEQQWADAAFVRDGSFLAMAELLRAGVTCINDMYFFPYDTAIVAEQVGIRAMLGLVIMEFPSKECSDADAYLARSDKLLADKSVSPSGRVNFCLAPHAPYTVTDSTFEKILELQQKHDARIHIHVHETETEVSDAVKEFSMRPIKRLNKLNMLSNKTLAIHCTQLNDEDIQILAETGTHVIHCPESNMKLASGICPVVDLLGKNINVGLGTDGVASNNDLDMIGEMRTASLLAKVSQLKAEVLPAYTCLQMATINGAKALGLDDKIGSLEPGKQADIIAIEMSAIENQPLYDPVASLVYSTDRRQVSDVWVAGKQLLANRQLTTIDESTLIQRTVEWREKIAHQTNKDI